MIENWLGLAPRSLVRRFAAVVAVAVAGLSSGQLWSPARAASIQLGKVPPFYVTLRVLAPACCQPGQPFAPHADAVVRATATGAVIATVAAPGPYFTFVAVSGAADDRTFVLAAQRRARFQGDQAHDPATRFFLLRIDPRAATASQRATLTALPIPEEPKGVDLNDIAVSPDGSKLAVTSTSNITVGQVAAPRLHVFNMATGAERSWQGIAFPQKGDLSWAADNTTLQLVGQLPSGRFCILLLDIAKPGSDLVANSRAVNLHGNGWRATAISGNGQTIAVVRGIGRRNVFYEQPERIDARTGQVISTFNATAIHTHDLQIPWASQTGQVLIVTGAGPHNTGAGIYTGHQYTPIPWRANLSTAAW